MAEATRDPAVLKARFDAALAVLKSNEHVDPQRVGAIGYCFGGAVVLSMARLGEDLDAVASFHGALGATAPISGAIHPRILVAAGADDPMVPPAQVDKFEKEMTGAGAKIEVIRYPGAKHGFTNPEAGKYGMDALAYDAEADRKSWEALLKMLKEVFKA
jgi:dienelactone hydrolase